MYDNSSSKAENRELKAWYNLVKEGNIKLPRFQRGEAWDKNRITSFLNTIVTNLPVGITLVLHVDFNKEQFVSRFIETAEKEGSPRVTEHLLDGQQRITALWRSMNDNYEYESYFVYIPDYDLENQEPDNEIQVINVSRYYKGDQRYPLWANDPEKSFEKGLFPLTLFRPEEITTEMTNWIDQATAKFLDEEKGISTKDYISLRSKLERQINSLRETIAHYNLPYLSLPPSTEKAVALKVFTDMNTNSKPLSQFDIIKAQVEQATGESLDDMLKDLDSKHPKIKRYFDIGDLALSASALLQGKVPNKNGIFSTDLEKMIKDWPLLERCLGNMANLMEANGIYDRERLPTNAVLGVVTACYADIPDFGDKRGFCETILKKYIWSAFFTDRYENSAATRAHSDCVALKKILSLPELDTSSDPAYQEVPIFDRKQYPLPDMEQLLAVGWPKRANIRARAILAVSTLLGAYDFADGQKITPQNIADRHYHHIFPLSLLKESGLKKERYDVALNCSLITGNTNQEIGRKDPYDYLVDRYKWASKDIVQDRLYSHLIPISELKTGSYIDLEDDIKANKIQKDFESFLYARAALIQKAIEKLVSGQDISAYALMNEEKKDKAEIIRELIAANENKELEYKSTLRKCLNDQIPQNVLEHEVLKNIAGFMNSNGGKLIIGYNERSKEIIGLEKDYGTFNSEDKQDAFLRHIDNLIKTTFGNSVVSIFDAEIVNVEGKDMALLTVRSKSAQPVWLNNKEKKDEEFWVRRTASAEKLSPKETNDYIQQHW